jgi:hypothetical protein
MREILVDASAWIALTDRGDKYHRQARDAYPLILREYRVLVTTNLIVAESHVTILHAAGYHCAIRFLDTIRESTRILKVYSDEELESEAEDILRQYSDQDFSFADAVSFALMRKRGIKEAFAFDRHFLTAGFALVPPYTPRGLQRRHLRQGEGDPVNPAHPCSRFVTNGR